MIAARYIEITSLHRDRTRFPSPTAFHIELSAPDARNPKDSIYESAPKYPPPNFNGLYANVAYAYGVEINNVQNPYYIDILPIVSVDHSVATVIPCSVQIGDTIELVETVVGGVVLEQGVQRQVTDVEPIQKNIYNNTILSVLTSSSAIVNTICDIDGYFKGWSIRFLTTTDPTLSGVVRKVTDFRSYDNTLFYESVEPSVQTNNDTFELFLEGCRVQLDVPFSSNITTLIPTRSDYTTYRVRSGPETSIVRGSFVSGTMNTFVLPSSVGNTNFTGSMLWVTSDPLVFSGVFVSTGFTTTGGVQTQGIFTLNVSLPIQEDMYLTVTNNAFQGSTYLISQWNASTKTGKISTGWTYSTIAGAPNAGDSCVITSKRPSNFYYIHSYTPSTRSGNISPFFSLGGRPYAITSNDTFNILKFKADNYRPLDYTESMTHQQQIHCYDISLVSLSIPNVELKTGDRITQYPYVYIEFKSITQGTSAYNFSSNNPVVQQNIMFKAPVLYNYHLERSKFLTLDGNGMVQQLKFKPNDSFSFALYTPTGELLTFKQPDTFSPCLPNPDLQVSVCFGIRRTSG